MISMDKGKSSALDSPGGSISNRKGRGSRVVELDQASPESVSRRRTVNADRESSITGYKSAQDSEVKRVLNDLSKTSLDNSQTGDLSHSPSELTRENAWLLHLLSLFNCDSIPSILFTRALHPSKEWSNDGELVQVNLSCLNSFYPRFDYIDGDESPSWVQRLLRSTSNLNRKESLAKLIDSEDMAVKEVKELEVFSKESQLSVLVIVMSALPEPWGAIVWEAAEEQLWEVVESTCLPLLGVISIDDIEEFLARHMSHRKEHYLFAILKRLIRLTVQLGSKTPPNVFSLISRGIDLLGPEAGEDTHISSLETGYLHLLRFIAETLNSEEHPYVKATKLQTLDHGGSMRSNAAIGFALASLPPWIVSNSGVRDSAELHRWRPISPGAPSTMEVLAQAELFGVTSLTNRPGIMWEALPLDAKILVAFSEAKKKAFANAAEILSQHVNETKEAYGPKSLELLLIGTVLISCWNSTGQEEDGEKFRRYIWLRNFGTTSLDVTVETKFQIYLMVAMADSFLGQRKYEEAKQILTGVLKYPTVDNNLAMSTTLRLLKINRRLRDQGSLSNDWSRLSSAVKRFDKLSDTLKYECIEETICLLSNLEARDILQFPQASEVVNILSGYRIDRYRGAPASRANLLQNLEELQRFKSKLNLFSFSGPRLYYCRKMRDRFPTAYVPFVERVASANWQRSKSIKEMREVTQEVGVEVEARPAHAAKSLFLDSGIGSSIGSGPMGVEPPLQLRSKARSVTSIYSYMPNKEGEASRPPLPPENSNGEIICVICEKPLNNIKTDSQWRSHIFADLRPYVCIVEDCEIDHMNFASRIEFAAHLHEHRHTNLWTCTLCGYASGQKHLIEAHIKSTHKVPRGHSSNQAISVTTVVRDLSKQKCPFCDDIPGVVEFVGHVCHHLEEISLSAIPRDGETDEETSTRTQDVGIDAIIGRGPVPLDEIESARQNTTENPWGTDENSQFFSTNGVLLTDEHSDWEFTIKCICDFKIEDGNTILCMSCDTLQHTECYYPGRVEQILREDFEHFCLDCKPRPMNRQNAKEQATARGLANKTGFSASESLVKIKKRRSKNGCITCRKQKTKCDETKPSCLNCEKNSKICEGYAQRMVFVSGKGKAEEAPLRLARIPPSIVGDEDVNIETESEQALR